MASKPSWTCPNCNVLKFDSQNKMVQHALQCKREPVEK